MDGIYHVYTMYILYIYRVYDRYIPNINQQPPCTFIRASVSTMYIPGVERDGERLARIAQEERVSA